VARLASCNQHRKPLYRPYLKATLYFAPRGKWYIYAKGTVGGLIRPAWHYVMACNSIPVFSALLWREDEAWRGCRHRSRRHVISVTAIYLGLEHTSLHLRILQCTAGEAPVAEMRPRNIPNSSTLLLHLMFASPRSSQKRLAHSGRLTSSCAVGICLCWRSLQGALLT
jgi:hypothetical protein